MHLYQERHFSPYTMFIVKMQIRAAAGMRYSSSWMWLHVLATICVYVKHINVHIIAGSPCTRHHICVTYMYICLHQVHHVLATICSSKECWKRRRRKVSCGEVRTSSDNPSHLSKQSCKYKYKQKQKDKPNYKQKNMKKKELIYKMVKQLNGKEDIICVAGLSH